MSNEHEIYSTLSSILGDILFRDPPQLRPETVAADIEGWDSIVQINLLVAVEEEYNIRISSRQVDEIAKVGDLVELIAAAR